MDWPQAPAAALNRSKKTSKTSTNIQITNQIKSAYTQHTCKHIHTNYQSNKTSINIQLTNTNKISTLQITHQIIKQHYHLAYKLSTKIIIRIYQSIKKKGPGDGPTTRKALWKKCAPGGFAHNPPKSYISSHSRQAAPPLASEAVESPAAEATSALAGNWSTGTGFLRFSGDSCKSKTSFLWVFVENRFLPFAHVGLRRKTGARTPYSSTLKRRRRRRRRPARPSRLSYHWSVSVSLSLFVCIMVYCLFMCFTYVTCLTLLA